MYDGHEGDRHVWAKKDKLKISVFLASNMKKRLHTNSIVIELVCSLRKVDYLELICLETSLQALQQGSR